MELSSEIQISCRRCGRKTSSKSMKFDMNGKDLICPDCYNKQHAKMPAILALSKVSKVAAGKSKTAEQKSETLKSDNGINKVKYYCTTCNFRFSRNEGMFVNICPNCAKDTVYLVTSNKITDIMEDNFLKKRVYEDSV